MPTWAPTDAHEVSLNVGENTIRVRVTAAAGNTETYTIRVNRAGEPATDATLATLTLTDEDTREVTLSPAFYSAITSYTAQVRHDAESITVAAVATTTANTGVAYTPADADANTSGHQVDLEVGTATIRVTVTAQDERTKKTYTIRVTRVRLVQDATLQSLTLSAGRLSPAFSSNRTAYTASVANSVSSITIRATPTVSGSTAQIGGADATSGRGVLSQSRQQQD